MKSVAAVLFVCSQTAFGAIAFGPETPVAAPVVEPAPLAQFTPRIASNGEGFGVVWVDTRGGSNDVVGALLDSDGDLLPNSATGIPIARSGSLPAIAWTKRRYVVVYAVNRLVYSVGLLPDGRLGPTQQVFGSGSVGFGPIEIASNGDTALVVTTAGSVLLDYFGNLVARVATLATSANPFVSVRTDGSDYIVSLIDRSSNVVVQRVTNSGTVTTISTLAVPNANAITSAGDLIVVTANENILSIPTNHGAISGPAIVAKSFNVPWPVTPRLIGDVNGYELAFTRDGGDQLFIALSNSGAGIEPQRTLGKSADGERPDIATNGGRVIAVWPERPGRLAAAVVSNSGVTRLPPIARSARAELSPRVSGLTPLTLWTEVIDGTRSELRMRKPNGSTATVETSNTILSGDIASDGSTVWVWWLDGVVVKVRRFTQALDPIDAQPVVATIGPATQIAGAAGSGNLLLVVRRQVGGEGDLDAVLIGSSGSPSSFALTAEIWDDRDPDVAWSGKDFVATWIHRLGPLPGFGQPTPTDELLAARISSGGGITIGPVQVLDPKTYISAVRVAAVDNDAAIAWQLTSSPQTVFGTIFNAAPRPAVLEWASGSPQQLREITRNGSGFVLLTTSNTTIETRDVTRSGLAGDPAVVATLDGSSPDSDAHIALNGGVAVIAYVRRVDGPDYGGVPRVFFRATPTQRLRAVR